MRSGARRGHAARSTRGTCGGSRRLAYPCNIPGSGYRRERYASPGSAVLGAYFVQRRSHCRGCVGTLEAPPYKVAEQPSSSRVRRYAPQRRRPPPGQRQCCVALVELLLGCDTLHSVTRDLTVHAQAAEFLLNAAAGNLATAKPGAR